MSLDSLDDELFGKINGRGVGVEKVIKGIMAAKEAGLGVKVNMVVKKGLNDHEIIPMAEFCKNTNCSSDILNTWMSVPPTVGKWMMSDKRNFRQIERPSGVAYLIILESGEKIPLQRHKCASSS